MEARNKNILIGGLLAIVLVMAVGYAAFATQLQINGTAEITSRWDVHFDKSAYVEQTDVVATKTFAGGSLPTGTLTYGAGDAPLTADIDANLNQPGDKVVFTLRIINAGTLSATAATPTLSGAGFTIDNLTAVSTGGHVKYTVTAPSPTVLPPTSGNLATMTVTAEFIDTVAGSCSDNSYQTKAACEAAEAAWTEGTTGNMNAENPGALTITINYTQTS